MDTKIQQTQTTRNVERALREMRGRVDRELGAVLQELAAIEREETEQARQAEPELHDGCDCQGAGADGR